MRGAPARAIQESAGHKDLSMTQRYMHLSPAGTRRGDPIARTANAAILGGFWRRGGDGHSKGAPMIDQLKEWGEARTISVAVPRDGQDGAATDETL